VATALDL